MVDPLDLAQRLLRCRSVTPADAGAQAVLAGALTALGFSVNHLRFGDIENLFARRGTASPHFCFAGHTDVVPPAGTWQHDPFAATVQDGMLYGRGACDMKGAIAAFVSACEAQRDGSVSLLITGDEEGEAVDGTVRVLDWMVAHGQIPDACLVGEPTSRAVLGDTVKIGRRGSLNATLTVRGVAGHAAYPERAANPVHALLRALEAMLRHQLDQGSEWFQPSGVQVTSVDVGNGASNVIPAEAKARLNIRFGDQQHAAGLEAWLRSAAADFASGPGLSAEVAVRCNADPFRTAPGPLTEAIAAAIGEVTGLVPALDTGGGTSDARFVSRLCPVAEFGLVGATMHQADERVGAEELRRLAAIYGAVVGRMTRQARPGS